MQYFTTQLNSNQQTTHTLRENQYRRLRKRRRGDVSHDSSSPEPEATSKSASRDQSYASHASTEIAQLRVAGLLPDDESDVPPSPFPHAPVKAAEGRYGAGQLQEEIAKPPARLYAVDALYKNRPTNKQNEATSLRKTHLNVLSTLMHRCLLEGDYERAGRAWGMLLRTHVAGGHPVDPRNHGRWGVGAEILLRKAPNRIIDSNNMSNIDGQFREHDMFSEEGFDLAREYYERFIIQFPYRKLTPHSVDERTFYPAMFSLWVFEVCEKTRAQEDAVQTEELARAREIAERLDQLIASPPFDKQASLLHLRGHVSLWISTLLLGRSTDDEDWDMDTTSELEDSNSPTANVNYTKRSKFCNERKQMEHHHR
ncbi:hypothetical protein SNOG_12680 [Parastagonospora nodorum SN15]|uniref:Transcription factor domain-containing protein n=1 Tax=Phaeosphaeria nodorum (strain SN15 / ATCC MYA-4574 / FGSC 10173) TaxID=321614 RepID=Q0U6D4_PHANO|nr:hypothetical protein SNOG_12680 [Parastagonospora nodorum SN15]EAT79978.2 hypothetical protein SNOG_12680 [Parastagonospora nodorum SN15]